MNMTARTSEDPFGERHLLPVSTLTACLTRIGGIHVDQHSASFFRFARELSKECRPRGVGNAFGKTMVMDHLVHHEVFDTDDTEPINNLPTILVSEVLSSERDALMDTCYDFAFVVSLTGAFLCLREFALNPGQCLLFLAEEPRILNFLTIRESRKGFESNVNPNGCLILWQAFRFAFTGEGNIPFAGRGATNGTRLDLTPYWAVVDHFHAANFGEAHPIIMRDGEAALGEGETIIAVLPRNRGYPGFSPALTRRKNALNARSMRTATFCNT